MRKFVVLFAVYFTIIFLQSCGQQISIPPETHPDVNNWNDLFTLDLSNAVFSEGIWTFENGILTASEDQAIWTKKEYKNFIIDLEFKQWIRRPDADVATAHVNNHTLLVTDIFNELQNTISS